MWLSMEPKRQAAFDRAIAAGRKHLSQNDPESALASFQLAHDLGRHLALPHIEGSFSARMGILAPPRPQARSARAHSHGYRSYRLISRSDPAAR